MMRMPGTTRTTTPLASLRTCRAALTPWIAIGLLLSGAERAWGGADRWTVQGGQGGGRVYALAVDPAEPRTLFAAPTMGGLFRSGDRGGHWVAVAGGPTWGDQPVLAIEPGDPRQDGTTYRSENGAHDWTRVAPSPLGATAALVLVVDPRRAATVYGSGGGRFFRSVDAGASWIEHSAGLDGLGFSGPLVVDLAHPARLLAGTTDGSILAIDLPR